MSESRSDLRQCCNSKARDARPARRLSPTQNGRPAHLRGHSMAFNPFPIASSRTVYELSLFFATCLPDRLGQPCDQGGSRLIHVAARYAAARCRRSVNRLRSKETQAMGVKFARLKVEQTLHTT